MSRAAYRHILNMDAISPMPANLPIETLLGGRAAIYALTQKADERGTLLPFEFSELPFTPRRVFVVRDVPPGAVRGRHRHRRSQHLLVCLAGKIDVLLRYKGEVHSVCLVPAERGLMIDVDVWAQQTYVLPDSVLLVLASTPYDPADYAHDPIDDPLATA
jgi:dTDP-4-dehydrorhamnose 3,5-epimerase-like enzyme